MLVFRDDTAMTQKELILAMDNWLAGKNSPLRGFSDFAVILARWNGVSLSLSLGVAQAETQCGTDPNADPVAIKGHNCWGYGHDPSSSHPHGYLFPTWPDGISATTEELGRFVNGTKPGFPPCDTIEKLGAAWVNGDKTLANVPAQWVNNVSFIMRSFGGDPEKLPRPPLARAQ